MQKLTARQARFVEEYSISRCASDAARRAGFAVSSAHVTGSLLLRNHKVLAALAVREAQTARELDLTRAEVLLELQDAIHVAKLKNDPATVIAGWREIAKMCGFYSPERHTVDVTDSGKAYLSRLEAMSDEELLEIARAEPF
ncbi:MAG: terminase small subunit [Nitrosomonadales bacterium]|nr:terminase small subunit [Nitrosomonadales bacterium]